MILHPLARLISLFGLIITCVFLSNCSQPSEESPRNVILITVDTLRADHLGVYGYHRDTSPNIDSFAQSSVLFRRAYSQSSETNPSLSSLLTGYFPHETKVVRNRYKLPQKATTLAEILRDNGYRTAAFVSNFTLRKNSGFDQGFDVYDDKMDNWSTKNWEGFERIAPKTTQAATQWLEGHHSEPFFLWIHYMDPHGPYTPPEPHRSFFSQDLPGKPNNLPMNHSATGKGGIQPYAKLEGHRDARYYISQYDGEIRFLDHWFGRLLEKIKALGLLENTLLIFGADHGEGMGEHEYYFAHLEFVYEGLIHVPLIVRFPNKKIGGSDIAYPVQNIDIVPTILSELGIASDPQMQGAHLLDNRTRNIFAETHYRGSKYAMIIGDQKLIKEPSTGDPREYEFYNLQDDPHETRDVFTKALTDQFETVVSLKTKLTDAVTRDALKLGPPDPWRIDLETRRKFEALGYVQ